jgi:hypothetical protein
VSGVLVGDNSSVPWPLHRLRWREPASNSSFPTFVKE